MPIDRTHETYGLDNTVVTPGRKGALKDQRARVKGAKRWRENEGLDETWKRLRNIYRLKHFKTKSDEDRIAVAVSFATINVIAPSIAVNNPKITVWPTLEDPDHQNKAQIAEGVINYWWRHHKIKTEFRRAVKDFLVYGHGWIKTGWIFEERERLVTEEETRTSLDEAAAEADQFAASNPELAAELPTDEDIIDSLPQTVTETTKDHPFVVRVSPLDVFVDPGGTSESDLTFLAQRVVRPFDEARNDPRYKSSVRRKLKPDGELKWQNKEDSGGAGESTYGKLVTVWEYYDLLNETVSVFPDVGESFLVDPEPWPRHCGLPFVMIRNYDVPDQFYPLGDLEAIEPLQHELNETRSAMVIGRKLDRRKWLYRTNGFGDKGIEAMKSDDDNVAVPVENDTPFAELVSVFPRNPPSPQLYQHSEVVEADINNISGISEYQRGSTPDTRQTATEASIIQDAANARASDKLATIETATAEVASKLLALAQTYLTDEQTARFTSPNGQEVYWTFTAADIEGRFDFEVEAGSTQPRNETFRRTQATQLATALAPFVQMGVVNPHELVTYLLREGFGVKQPEKFLLAPLGGGPAPPPTPPQEGSPPSPEDIQPPNLALLYQMMAQGGGGMGPGGPVPPMDGVT